MRFIFFFAIGALLIWLSVHNLSEEDVKQIEKSLTHASYLWIVLSIFLSVFSHISRAVRWKMLLSSIGHKPKTYNTFFAVMVGYLANYAVPRLGEISRCGVLTRYEKIPFNESLGTVVAERIIDVICFFAVVLIMVIMQAKTITTYISKNFYPLIESKLQLISSNPALSIALVTIMFIIVALIFFFRKRIKHLIGEKFHGFIKGFVNGMAAVSKLNNPWLFVFHSVFIWVVYYVCMHLIFFSLPETNMLGLGAGLSVFLAGTLMVMVTPGGLGAYPLAVQSIMAVYAINANTGLAVGWLVWLSQFVLILALGAASLVLLPLFNKTKNGTASPRRQA